MTEEDVTPCPVDGCPRTCRRTYSCVNNHLMKKHPGLGNRERSLLIQKALNREPGLDISRFRTG